MGSSQEDEAPEACCVCVCSSLYSCPAQPLNIESVAYIQTLKRAFSLCLYPFLPSQCTWVSVLLQKQCFINTWPVSA